MLKMTRYKNLDRSSSVIAYSIHENIIDVLFSDYSVYRYEQDKIGNANFETMARMAKSGAGLNAFINMSVKNNYSCKDRLGIGDVVIQ